MLFTADDMRAESLAEYAAGCALTIDEADDAPLEQAIVRLTARFQDWTNDVYEPFTTTLDIDGVHARLLPLPYRTTAITSVTFRQSDGTFTAAQDPTSYHLSSSLNAAGDAAVTDIDYLEVVPFSSGFSWVGPFWDPYFWPSGPRIVRVAGTFGWILPPADAKAAVAMLVFDHFKPIRADLGRAQSWQGPDLSVNVAVTDDDHPSGIPRVDEIVQRLRKGSFVGVG